MFEIECRGPCIYDFWEIHEQLYAMIMGWA